MEIQTHTLANGLTLVAEPMPEVRAAALQILLPCGAATDPEDGCGAAALLESMAYRGAGTRDARALSEALDELGVQRGGGADLESTLFAATVLSEDLHAALAIYADIVRRPRLEAGSLEGAKQLALERLDSVQDLPTQRLFLELSQLYFPGVHGRSPLGTRAGLERLTADALREEHSRRYRPGGAIVSVAGRFDWGMLRAVVEELFVDWKGTAPLPPPPVRAAEERYRHLDEGSAQEHLALAWPDVAVGHPGFYASRMGLEVLSGGAASRLFTEVREKRGLVYSVGASPRTVRGAGLVVAYAGTTPDRRQECLDVMVVEILKLPQGVAEAELERARTGILTAVVMQGEACSARAGALARDQFMLGRARSLAEVRAEVEAVTADAIREHLAAHPPGDFTVVSLGPEPVALPTEALS